MTALTKRKPGAIPGKRKPRRKPGAPGAVKPEAELVEQIGSSKETLLSLRGCRLNDTANATRSLAVYKTQVHAFKCT